MWKFIYREFEQDRISIYEINDRIELEGSVKAHNYHLIMLTSGEMTIDINHRVFRMKPNSTLHISAGEVISMIGTSKEINGYHIVFSPEFQTEMRTTRRSPISLQLKKEFPYQEFSEIEYEFLLTSVKRLIIYIESTSHHYQPIVVKNEVHSLLLNISNKRRQVHGYTIGNANYQEMIRERFRSLVEGHCIEQHSVSWYADALKISPDYLSKIIREYDGTSARVWINRELICKAEYIMQQSDLSIKEISDRLNFPDQSSFGRFYKSNTGQSPKEFRRKLTGKVSEQDQAENIV